MIVNYFTQCSTDEVFIILFLHQYCFWTLNQTLSLSSGVRRLINPNTTTFNKFHDNISPALHGHVILNSVCVPLQWNEVTRLFRAGMPLRKHRQNFRHYASCFTAAAAVEWLHQLLRSNSNFGPDVTRQQTVQLLKKFLKNHVIEDVKGRWGTEDLEDNNVLYRYADVWRNIKIKKAMQCLILIVFHCTDLHHPYPLFSFRFPSTSPLKPIPCPAPSSIKKRPSLRDKEGFFRFRGIKKQEKETQVSWNGGGFLSVLSYVLLSV